MARALIWSGGAANLRSEIGAEEGPNMHAHFAVQVTVGLVGEVSLRSGPRTPERLAAGWLVGSDRPHSITAGGPSATLLMNPLAEPGRRIAARLGGADVLAISAVECEAIRRELTDCRQQGWRLQDVRAAADRIANLLFPAALLPDSIDPRVRTVIDSLTLDPSENVGLGTLAARVGLSESRLAHLFRRDVGIPMRPYRLSLRVKQAVVHISLGSSLTEAAHMSGFSDSAHFCRICRRICGIAPSHLPDFDTEH